MLSARACTILQAARSRCAFALRQTTRRSHTLSEGSVSYMYNSSNGAQVFLVGTAHVSKQSAKEVKEVIEKVKPGTVFVELCQGRLNRIRHGKMKDETYLGMFQEVGRLQMGIGGKSVALAMKLGQKLLTDGLEMGVDFRAAVEAADAVGAQIVLGDQEAARTFERIAQAVPLWELARLVPKLMSSNAYKDAPPAVREMMEHLEGADLATKVETMKFRARIRDLISFLEKDLPPGLMEALLHERDEIMARRLRACGGTVVGVVGMAHMDGIERRWYAAEGVPVQS